MTLGGISIANPPFLPLEIFLVLPKQESLVQVQAKGGILNARQTFETPKLRLK